MQPVLWTYNRFFLGTWDPRGSFLTVSKVEEPTWVKKLTFGRIIYCASYLEYGAHRWACKRYVNVRANVELCFQQRFLNNLFSMDWHIFLTFDDMSIVCPRRPCRGTVVEMHGEEGGGEGGHRGGGAKGRLMIEYQWSESDASQGKYRLGLPVLKPKNFPS